MADAVNKILNKLGLEETAIDIDEYTVVSVGCLRTTFLPHQAGRLDLIEDRLSEMAFG